MRRIEIPIFRLFKGFWKAIRDPEVSGLLMLTMIVLAFGTIFYYFAEGWNIIDSLYFCVMTLTTIGYGDLFPTTEISKIFTILYVFLGLGLILSFINKLVTVAEDQYSMKAYLHRKKRKEAK